ncbi:hypothetical protein [Actinomadura sp. 3N407]|uniref:hypothetical protein n=1 Tax=Actinomadura sp. 3N407 TaxID=3457423 RepID=UPI003FCE9B51
MLRRILSVGVIGAAAVLLSASPALAGTNVPPTYSTDNLGAGGKFTHKGDVFEICDLRLDGRRAKMSLWSASKPNQGGDVRSHGWLEDTTANGKCVTKTVDITEGRYVFFKISTYNVSEDKYYGTKMSPDGRA